MKNKTKEQRITAELKRLTSIYKNIDETRRKVVNGLIERAAYMRIQLEDYEKDINDNGYVEEFSQSDRVEPYQRKRPVADLYNSMNSGYQKITKQLCDILPDIEPEQEIDEFEEFVRSRDD